MFTYRVFMTSYTWNASQWLEKSNDNNCFLCSFCAFNKALENVVGSSYVWRMIYKMLSDLMLSVFTINYFKKFLYGQVSVCAILKFSERWGAWFFSVFTFTLMTAAAVANFNNIEAQGVWKKYPAEVKLWWFYYLLLFFDRLLFAF